MPATDAVALQQPDMVLTDISLKKERDGIDTARRIKPESGVPIISAASHHDGKTLQRANGIRPDGVIIKTIR